MYVPIRHPDFIGNVTSVYCANVYSNSMASGYTTNYEYNKNRLAKVQIDGSEVKNPADSANVRYEYYADGKLKSVIYLPLSDGSVLKSEYVYDGLSRLLSLTNHKGTEILSSYSYTYDNNGNILTAIETVGGISHSTTYTYDKLNRVKWGRVKWGRSNGDVHFLSPFRIYDK